VPPHPPTPAIFANMPVARALFVFVLLSSGARPIFGVFCPKIFFFCNLCPAGRCAHPYPHRVWHAPATEVVTSQHRFRDAPERGGEVNPDNSK
jgi:hypothetical protein